MEAQILLDKVRRDETKFISLQFSDLVGVIKEIVIPAKNLEDALENGVWFDGSSVEGFARIQESDLFLKPDPSTYSLIPWLNNNGKTARLICDIHKPNGKPFEGDPRFVLKRASEKAKKRGFEFKVGPEPEFYLFNNNKPIDKGSYFDFSSHEGYMVTKKIIESLQQLNIDVETSHHEVGEGQYEIDFNYDSALKIADRLLTLKYTVKKIAQMHELKAIFMPKPIMNAAGSGMHVHQSLFREGKNVFYDSEDRYNLSDTAKSFIAGQMEHIKEISAVICPTVNSYKRLVSGFEAPVYITWAGMNRSALIRVPRWLKGKANPARIELRCPDPTCNPYLAFSVMLSGGLDGIERKLSPPEPVEENVYEFDRRNLSDKKIATLPTSLLEALNEMKKSQLVKDTLGKYLFKKYLEIKTKEWDEFKQQVTNWELKKYMDIY